jgi:hypothetical protein
MVKNGLHDMLAPDKLIKFRGAESKFPSQQQEEEETGIVDGRTEYVVQRIRAHRDVFPRGKAPIKQGKRLYREYLLVQWKGDKSKGSWTWKKVEDLNDEGVLGSWQDYEAAAVMRHDPAKASQLYWPETPSPNTLCSTLTNCVRKDTTACKPSLAPSPIAMYSASQVLRATVCCLFDCRDTGDVPGGS